MEEKRNDMISEKGTAGKEKKKKKDEELMTEYNDRVKLDDSQRFTWATLLHV